MRRVKNFTDFINEAEETSSTKAGELTVPVGGTFASGEFTIKNEKLLGEKLPEIMSFLKKYPLNQRMEVKVAAMESQVPNRGVGLKEGDLAQKRTEAMIEYLKEKLKEFKNVTITAEKPQIGPTKWAPEKGDKADDEKFTKEQRVDIVIKPIGEAIKVKPKGEEFSFSVKYDGGLGKDQWSIARMGTWGFTVEDKDKANKIYDSLTKGGSTTQGNVSKGEDKFTKDGEKYKFFGSDKFRTFDKIEDFKEFFGEFGGDLKTLQTMPDYFFQKPSGPGSYGANNPIENGLRPIWKITKGSKDRTL
jgi:hypothetical protein